MNYKLQLTFSNCISNKCILNVYFNYLYFNNYTMLFVCQLDSLHIKDVITVYRLRATVISKMPLLTLQSNAGGASAY